MKVKEFNRSSKIDMYVYVLDCEFPKLRNIDIVESVSCAKGNMSRVIAVNNTVCEHSHAYGHL